jgi:uncharacterized protein YlxP (DUF503 family)
MAPLMERSLCMSKVKTLKRKRAMQKKANIRKMAFQKKWGASLKEMTGNNVDVLQNIEFALLREYENDTSIDDRAVAEALRAAFLNTRPDDDTAQLLKDSPQQIRAIRSGVPDDIWGDGLRTVLQSVLRHSSLKPGCTHNLDFVSGFGP